jgi:hypothetical protein
MFYRHPSLILCLTLQYDQEQDQIYRYSYIYLIQQSREVLEGILEQVQLCFGKWL